MSQASPVVWKPTGDYLEQSQLARFMRQNGIGSFAQLIRRSEQDLGWFWRAFIEFAGIEFYQPFTQCVDLSGGLPWPKWFMGGKINLVHNFLDKWAASPGTAARPALIWEGEDGAVRRWSFGELEAEASRVAHALRALGIERGDRVAIYMPMIPETVAAAYGIYKAGLVAMPLFSGFGPDAVALRLADVEAKAVVTAGGFLRGGKRIPLKAVLDKALENVPTVKAVIVAERLGEASYTPGRDHRWSEVVASQPARFETIRTDSEDVCMVSYSSGTTGKPKGIVHVQGGISVKAAENGMLGCDIRAEDVVFMITDFGWMMGQLPLFSAHAVAAPLLMYEGSPVHPHPGRVFELIERHRVTSFGAPATALRILKAYAEPYRQRADLSTLRILVHTGEPIDEDTWQWYFSWGAGKAPIINASGGTELFGEILMSTVLQPLKPSCLGVMPAIGARVVDDRGEPVAAGTPGYLAFTLPQPAQTRGFWKDRERYLETYFPLGTHLWWHGDMAVVDAEGFWFHLGRGDDVIKVAGRKTGPGEIEDVLARHPGVLESAVIGVPHPLKGQAIVAFVVPRPGASPAPDELRALVTEAMGKGYEPAAVHLVRDLPKTRTQKIVRRLIRQKYLGEPLGDTSNLMNVEALDLLPVAEARSS